MEVVIGTYEEYLLGYELNAKNKELNQTFSTHSHSASIRTVCTSDNYLASGGADDRIFVYDLKTRKEQCTLTHHSATVNCLAFTPEHTHLISGSEDGSLAIVRVGNWQLEKLWEKAHKGAAILAIAIHSSGKLALTLGADCTLATWNLVKGRQAYVTNLTSKSKDPKSLERIGWAPSGVQFMLMGGKYTDIWSIETGGLINSIEHPRRVTSCSWLSNESLVVGYENGKVGVVTISSRKIETYDAHLNRIKAVVCNEKYIVSITSDGEITVWDKELNKICSVNSGCRNICLCTILTNDTKEDTAKIEQSEVQVVEKSKTVQKRAVVHVEQEHDDSESQVHETKKKKANETDPV